MSSSNMKSFIPQLSPIFWSSILILMVVSLLQIANLLPKDKELTTCSPKIKKDKKSFMW